MTVDLQALFDAIPFHAAQDRFIVARTQEGVVFRGRFGRDASRASDSEMAHGGAVASLLDTAATFALVVATDRSWATVDIRVDLLRPVSLGTVTVTARVDRAGRRFGRGAAELHDADGQLCATAVGTFAPEAGPVG